MDDVSVVKLAVEDTDVVDCKRDDVVGNEGVDKIVLFKASEGIEFAAAVDVELRAMDVIRPGEAIDETEVELLVRYVEVDGGVWSDKTAALLNGTVEVLCEDEVNDRDVRVLTEDVGDVCWIYKSRTLVLPCLRRNTAGFNQVLTGRLEVTVTVTSTAVLGPTTLTNPSLVAEGPSPVTNPMVGNTSTVV